MYTLQFDGLFKALDFANPASGAGIMCYAWLIFKDNRLVARGHGACAHSRLASSSSAEYLALIEGLEALRDMGVRGDEILITGDAKSVIDQMAGDAGISSQPMRALHRRAARLARAFPRVSWCWQPRQYNREADRLTRHAMRQFRGDRREYQAALQSIRAGGRSGARQMLPLIDFRIYQPAAL